MGEPYATVLNWSGGIHERIAAVEDKHCWLLMAERTPIEIIQSLSRQRGHSEPGVLVLTHTFDARPGERISHLPVSQHLVHAWVTLTGAPFRPHQALALSALRRGEAFALLGSSATARQTMHLLLLEELLRDPQASTLLLAPDLLTARLYRADLRRLGELLPTPPVVTHIEKTTPARDAAWSQIVLTTPEILHQRMLRHHDRAWQPFWARLHAVALANVEHYSGVAGAHLAGLLLRSMRLVPTPEPPLLVATLNPVQHADRALLRLSGVPWRLINVDDAPRPAAALAVWQAGQHRLQETVSLALALHRADYRVHIVCDELETPLLLDMLDQDRAHISVGALPRAAQVHIFAGYPGSHALLHQSLMSGVQLTVLVLGAMPIERTLARLPDSLVSDPLPELIPAPTNAYVSARHLLCASTERPLSLEEVTAWRAEDIVDHLQSYGQMARLPDDDAAWQPLPAAGDPYDAFSIRAVGSAAVPVYDEYDQLLSWFDPAAFDRWGFPDAALPLGRGSYRVVGRDDEAGSLIVRIERQYRSTLPLRSCEVIMREHDEREKRMLRGRMVGWGRVVVEEEIYGYREVQPGSAPVEHTLSPSLTTRWTAPALWIDLPLRMRSSGQMIGWSLVAALPLRVLAHQTDVIPVYDAGLGRLYIIDAQPGGNGLAAWLYRNLETVLPLAYDVALDYHSDPLLEPAARTDMDWLLTMLGGEFTLPERPAAPGVSRDIPERDKEPPASHTAPERVPAPPEPAQPAPSASPAEPPAEPPASPPEPEPEQAEAAHTSPPQETRPARKTRRSSSSKRRSASASKQDQDEQSTAKSTGAGKGRRKRAAAPEPETPPVEPETPPAESETPPAEPQAAPAEARTESMLADPKAILDRLLRMREQYEQQPLSSTPPAEAAAPAANTAPRFQVGERVFCLPYGAGVVRANRFVQNRELLSVEFPELGQVEVDPAVNVVRRIEAPTSEQADDA